VGTPEKRLRQIFTVTQNITSAVLKLSYTAFQSVTSCNSGLTFARISVQKSGGSGERVPPGEKSGGTPSPPHYTPELGVVAYRVRARWSVNWSDCSGSSSRRRQLMSLAVARCRCPVLRAPTSNLRPGPTRARLTLVGRRRRPLVDGSPSTVAATTRRPAVDDYCPPRCRRQHQ